VGYERWNVNLDEMTYFFATRFDGDGVAELPKADEEVVGFGSGLRCEGEVEDDHCV
jgi:hypothetical protein